MEILVVVVVVVVVSWSVFHCPYLSPQSDICGQGGNLLLEWSLVTCKSPNIRPHKLSFLAKNIQAYFNEALDTQRSYVTILIILLIKKLFHLVTPLG